MSCTLPVNATGLPTRRKALASIAGFGAALSLPGAAQSAGHANSADAALISHAAMVVGMAERTHAAITRTCEIETEIERRMPIASRPKEPAALDKFDSVVEHFPDGGFVLRSVPKPVPVEMADAHRREVEARDAWEARRDAIAEDIGVDAAQELHSDLYAALEDAVRDLTPMVPTTIAGLAAKARVAVLLDPFQDFGLNDWEHALIGSVARDAARIGGAE